MKQKKVSILMSTYNGENYIAEQLDSLINQKYKNIEIYIRDDGSTDKTKEIIKEYMQKVKNIHLIEGINIGFMNSFFELLKISNDFDYYAYCDQDDVWMEDKIERAVKFLEGTDKDKPVLYFSNSDYYDSDMNFLGTAEVNKVYNFRNSLVECVTQGMTMVINETTRKFIVQNKAENVLFHDWWTYMICSGFGQIVYDNKSLVKYRRHNKSVTSEGKNIIQLLIWRINNFLFSDKLKQIKAQLKEYKKLYYTNLSDENKKILNLFTNEKYYFKIAIKKTFYPKRFRKKFFDEILVRILFIIGKL